MYESPKIKYVVQELSKLFGKYNELKMTSNWYTENLVYDSQNFSLRLSSGSSTKDSSPQRFADKKTNDEDDIIIISDSSCSSSPINANKPKWKPSSTTKVKSKEYRKFHFLEDSSSESEKERESPDSLWKLYRSDNKLSKKKHTSRTVMQINETPTETSSTSNDTSERYESDYKAVTSSNTSHDRNQVKESKRHTSHKSPASITRREINLKLRDEPNTEKINKIIKPSYATYSDSRCVVRKHPIHYTPKQDNSGKSKLTRKDTYNIFKNIKCTQLVYNSLRDKKQTDIIINDSTDAEDDLMHPAISPDYDKKKNDFGDSPDIIETSLKNNAVQVDLAKPSISRTNVTESFKPLSEKRKNQIRNWLQINSFDTQSECSFNTVPPSTRNSNSTGNSSLERLELYYETPNNRDRINKVQTEGKQRTISNFDKVLHSISTHQKTLEQNTKQTDNDSKFCTCNNTPNNTPHNKSKALLKTQTEKKAVDEDDLDTKVVVDYVNILDKLYGKSWRNKANILLPSTEPRKTFVPTVNKLVQTERKPLLKNHAAGLDVNEFDLVQNKKTNRRKNVGRKQKEADSFINDETSSNDDESIYHSALTNPTSTTNSTKSMQVPESIKRLQILCDTDTEDEDNKPSNNLVRLHGKKLSFSDDESSNTSEFDPGDYVPPKYEFNKEMTKEPMLSKTPSKTVLKSTGCKTFLASLSNTVPMSQIHPNAKKYRLNYKIYKNELCKKLYELYNEKVFDNKLPRDMSIEWNVRMRGTAGYCYNKKSVKSFSNTIVKSSRIVLATKILDTPDRLRDTLIHEMCHAASWIIDGVSDGHGHFWTKWANKAVKTFPELPPIRRCHNYEIKTKFTYKCTSCGYSIGRHSKSLDVKTKRCGYCYGKFELFINKVTKSGNVQQVQTPKKEPTGFALYVKKNYNSVRKEKSNMKHADVMKILGVGM
ncbi:hypothetical protein PUN28_013205 [Cardiocondyla obscurior]|uniref:SprT-like domain-containing protein n=1 Tax=Cardiocondyla obscurior TaxID=286306 RepID=A0AAW2FCC6_9HYME